MTPTASFRGMGGGDGGVVLPLHAELNVLRLSVGNTASTVAASQPTGLLNKVFAVVTGMPLLDARPSGDGTTTAAVKRATLLFETSKIQLLEWTGSLSERNVNPDLAPKQLGVSVLTLPPSGKATACPTTRLCWLAGL